MCQKKKACFQYGLYGNRILSGNDLDQFSDYDISCGALQVFGGEPLQFPSHVRRQSGGLLGAWRGVHQVCLHKS
jgi:hypothetical protein